MAPRPNLLLLTSKTGGGHVSLAQSLSHLLESDFSATILDPQPGVVLHHYRLVSRYALWLWAAEYRFTNTPERARVTHKLFTRVMKARLVELLQQTRPAVIITTYPYFSYSVLRALEELGASIPLVMLLSDPQSVHWSWLTVRDAALTLAPTRETHRQALAAGFAPERTRLAGWPVRRQFHEAGRTTPDLMAERMGFSRDRLTIFLQGGGEGAARFARTADTLLSIQDGAGRAALQLILAVGSNRTLAQRFRSVARCYVLPFTPEIAGFMAAADLVMGKAGPNFLFESVTLGKPFIATTYIPGQEEGNLDFIAQHRLGWTALTPDEQRTLITGILAHPEKLEARRATVRAYATWNAEANHTILPALQEIVRSPELDSPESGVR